MQRREKMKTFGVIDGAILLILHQSYCCQILFCDEELFFPDCTVDYRTPYILE